MRRFLLAAVSMCLLAACGSSPRHKDERIKPARAEELVGVWYTVVAGDTVQAISDRHRVKVDDIVELNGLTDPSRLVVGQALFLFGVDHLVRRLGAKTKPRKIKGVPALAWPIEGGVLTSGYGPRGRRLHKGIDIAKREGTPIYAAADGTVVYSNNKQRGYGNLVIIRHAEGVMTVYAHNRRNLVDEGQFVRQGAQIAELGNTGRSTGPHLHFELRVKGKAVDPLKYLPERNR